MVVIFSKQFKKIAFLSLFLLSSLQLVYSKNVDISFNEPIISINQDETSQKLSFEISPEIKDQDYTQTLSYLSNDGFKDRVSNDSEFQEKFKTLGKEAFSRFVVDPIVKEMEFRDDYYVFYHGQNRPFLFIQDLFARLSELVRKKAFKDFVMLRIPDKDHKKVKNTAQFLKEYKKELKEFTGWFDGQNHISKILLAVNPFLFGNTSAINWGECTFGYFLDSRSASYVDITNLSKNIFQNFNLAFNVKYEVQINELIKLLEKYEKNKTGILLQIFVPKDIVDDIVYRCVPGGKPYYDNVKKNASEDLSKYQEKKDSFLDKYLLNPGVSVKQYIRLGLYSYWVPFELLHQVSETWSCKLSGNNILYHLAGQPLSYLSEKCHDISEHAYKKYYEEHFMYGGVDLMQFRILLSEDIMLNPDSGVKIFRYFNETEAVKEYKIKLNKLMADISRDYNFLGLA